MDQPGLRIASRKGTPQSLKGKATLQSVARGPAHEATNASVVSAYETRIDKLERDRIVLQEKIENAVPEKGRLENCMELAMRFLSSSWNIYKNGDYALRQTVLRLAFAKPLRYSLNGVYGTPEFFLPIQIFRRNFWVKKRDGAAGEN